MYEEEKEFNAEYNRILTQEFLTCDPTRRAELIVELGTMRAEAHKKGFELYY